MGLIENLKELQTLGCDDLKKCSMALRVFIDISAKKTSFTKIDKIYDDEFDLLYIKAENNDQTKIFLPFLESDNLDMEWLEKFKEKVIKDKEKPKVITLAICDTASNILYYRLTSGLKNLNKPPKYNIQDITEESIKELAKKTDEEIDSKPSTSKAKKVKLKKKN